MNTDRACHNNKVALLTPTQMGEADRAAEASGVDGFGLMEAAGSAVAIAVGVRWLMRPVTVLCGPGKNGGDGFVAARHLAAAGWPVKLALLGSREKLTGEAAHAADLWTGGVAPFSPEILEGAGIVIDAISVRVCRGLWTAKLLRSSSRSKRVGYRLAQ